MKKYRILVSMLAGLLLTSISQSASAVLITQQFTGNDCSGFFGTGFGSCQIFIDDNGTRIEISPVIIKFDFEEASNIEINSVFSSVTGDEFKLNGSAFDPTAGNPMGTWSYDRGDDDPGVRYWAAKGGDFFNLFWDVDSADAQAGGVCESASFYNLDCLSAANVVTSGTWNTVVNPKNEKNFGLSHLTFYDSVDPIIPNPLPEPGILGLMGIGLFAVGLSKRRQKRLS